MKPSDHYWERLEKKIDTFLFNDFRHIAEDVAGLKAQMRIVLALLLMVAAAAVAVLGREFL